MNFPQAIQSGFQNYVNFKDRSSRPAFWFWVLFAFLVGVVASIIDEVIGGMIIQSLSSLALFLPGLAVGVRRLHDIGKSGWHILWGLIPILGWIYLIYLYVQPTQPVPNEWGTEPLAPPA